MPKQNVPLPPSGRWIGSDGIPTTPFRTLIEAMRARIGGSTDKVDQAKATADAAAPATAEVVAGAGLQIGGKVGGNVSLALYKRVDVLAALPLLGNQVGDVAYCINARNSGEGVGAGTGAQVVWSGSAWRINGVATGVTT